MVLWPILLTLDLDLENRGLDTIKCWLFENVENRWVSEYLLRLITGEYLSLILITTQHWFTLVYTRIVMVTKKPALDPTQGPD
jgi:hypothetical protein